MFAKEMFPHPYKECFVLLPNRRGISQSTPLQGPTSLLVLIPLSNGCGISQSTLLQGLVSVLTHRPVSGSDTICNGSSPPLADIFLFGLSLSSFPSRLLNTFVRERIPHPLCSPSQPMWDLTIHHFQGPASSLALVSFFNQCGISQFTPLRGPTSLLAHYPVSSSDTICNSPSPPLADIVLFGLSPSGFSSRFLKHVY